MVWGAGMRGGRCGKPLIEISMRTASESVKFRRCAHCDSQTWTTSEGEIALRIYSNWSAAHERSLPQRGSAGNLI
jgi:hypothetical protein